MNDTLLAQAANENRNAVTGIPRYCRYYDWQRRGYVENLLIDIGKPDGITPRDIDATLEPERLPAERRIHRHNKGSIASELIALLRQHGPLTLADLMQITGRTRPALQQAIDNDDRIVRVGSVPVRRAVYGVRG